ncbi:hypothetical protein F5B18DRAFT_669419 [Nemania serpens]|nr:hypothetical protein F5B18DRAFT_669419 [Nemania serpens]
MDSVAIDTHASRQILDASELQSLEPDTVLQRSLTVTSAVITASSYATQYQYMKHLVGRRNYHEIGTGLQGIVYEQLDKMYVTKKELLTNQGRSLSDEFVLHQIVSEAFGRYRQYSNDVRVPQPYDFIPKHILSSYSLGQLPESDRHRSDIATMERILPLPKVVRRAMIQKFYPDKNGACDEHLVAQLLCKRENKHCLARIYLGKGTIAMAKESFTLRNFPLTLDIMSDLGLDMVRFATMIGSAYAIMHWAANVTGDDVEFVLGTSTAAYSSTQDRAVHMYLLDFGQCERVFMHDDKEDIFQAFKGSMVLQQNQIYLPHPKRTTTTYQAWKSAYLSTAREIIHRDSLPFDPEEFIKEYEEYLEDFDP